MRLICTTTSRLGGGRGCTDDSSYVPVMKWRLMTEQRAFIDSPRSRLASEETMSCGLGQAGKHPVCCVWTSGSDGFVVEKGEVGLEKVEVGRAKLTS